MIELIVTAAVTAGPVVGYIIFDWRQTCRSALR